MATEQDYWNQMYANACDQNEVLSLRQQLEHWKANWEHEALESESLRQQLAGAIAACKMKDEALKWLMDWQVKHVDVWHSPAFYNAKEALSTTPDQALEQFAAKVRGQCDFECYKSNDYGLHRTYLDISNAIRAIKELPK